MEISNEALAALIAGAVRSQLAPINEQMALLQQRIDEAYKAHEPQADPNPEDEEAAEAAASRAYLAEMKSRLRQAGLMPQV